MANIQQINRFSTVKLSNKQYFSSLNDGDHGNPVYGQGVIYIRASEIKGNRLDEKIALTLDKSYAVILSLSLVGSNREM